MVGGAFAQEVAFSISRPWPTPPEIAVPLIKPETTRQELEAYRQALEARRQQLEADRENGLVTQGQYTTELDLYRIGLEIYREGIGIYRDAFPNWQTGGIQEAAADKDAAEKETSSP